MCNFFDDFDAEDFANLAGFIETQLEGEQEGQQQQKEPNDDIFDLNNASSDDQEEKLSDEDEW